MIINWKFLLVYWNIIIILFSKFFVSWFVKPMEKSLRTKISFKHMKYPGEKMLDPWNTHV